jgi:FtsZ-binding cell division protein ZapB
MAPKTYNGALTIGSQLNELRQRLQQVEEFLHPQHEFPLLPGAAPLARISLIDKYVALFKGAHQKGINELSAHVNQMDELMKGVQKEALANMSGCECRIDRRSLRVLEELDARRATFEGEFKKAQEYLKDLPVMDFKIREAVDSLALLAGELEDIPTKLNMFERKVQAITKRLDELSKLVRVEGVKEQNIAGTRRASSVERLGGGRRQASNVLVEEVRNMALNMAMKEATEANQSGVLTVEEVRINAAQEAAKLLRGKPFEPQRRSTSAPPRSHQAVDFFLLGPYVASLG